MKTQLNNLNCLRFVVKSFNPLITLCHQPLMTFSWTVFYIWKSFTVFQKNEKKKLTVEEAETIRRQKTFDLSWEAAKNLNVSVSPGSFPVRRCWWSGRAEVYWWVDHLMTASLWLKPVSVLIVKRRLWAAGSMGWASAGKSSE